jgi:hypothetical protein
VTPSASAGSRSRPDLATSWSKRLSCRKHSRKLRSGFAEARADRTGRRKQGPQQRQPADRDGPAWRDCGQRWRGLSGWRTATSDARKKDAREKIELGGLIVKAGLRYERRAVLFGALLELQRRLKADQGERARLTLIGAEAFGNDAE